MKRLVMLLPVLLAFQVGVQPALAWTWPVDGPVLRQFNLGGDPYAGGQHRGIDIGASVGAAVVAPAGGRVTFAGTVPTGGRTIAIRTPAGYSVTLLQLGAVGVARDQEVAEGDVVGLIGASSSSLMCTSGFACPQTRTGTSTRWDSSHRRRLVPGRWPTRLRLRRRPGQPAESPRRLDLPGLGPHGYPRRAPSKPWRRRLGAGSAA
jgi:hypothetical protein